MVPAMQLRMLAHHGYGSKRPSKHPMHPAANHHEFVQRPGAGLRYVFNILQQTVPKTNMVHHIGSPYEAYSRLFPCSSIFSGRNLRA